jgi:uncharacterized protein YebE (UPF0316 family)
MLDSLWPAAVIFCLRCVDVSLGTLRLIFTVQGRRLASSLVGFVEVSLFIAAVATAVHGPLDVVRVVAYGAGFATGTFLGVTIDRKLALGDVVVRAISRSYDTITQSLTHAGFGLTTVQGRGGRGSDVGIVFSVCRRRSLAQALKLIRDADSGATVTVEQVRQRIHGYFAPKRPGLAPLGPIAGP